MKDNFSINGNQYFLKFQKKLKGLRKIGVFFVHQPFSVAHKTEIYFNYALLECTLVHKYTLKPEKNRRPLSIFFF